MAEPSSDFDDNLTHLLAYLDTMARRRPPWWRDPDEHDERADRRDDDALDRDVSAERRDHAAQEREADARQRERAAVHLTRRAHGRLSRQEATDAALQLAHVESAAGLAHVFAELRSAPEHGEQLLERAKLDLELHLDRAYASLLAMTIDGSAARSELRGISDHLAAAAGDRLAAAQDRARALEDRTAARLDREHALVDRQRAALDRAASDDI